MDNERKDKPEEESGERTLRRQLAEEYLRVAGSCAEEIDRRMKQERARWEEQIRSEQPELCTFENRHRYRWARSKHMVDFQNRDPEILRCKQEGDAWTRKADELLAELRREE